MPTQWPCDLWIQYLHIDASFRSWHSNRLAAFKRRFNCEIRIEALGILCSHFSVAMHKILIVVFFLVQVADDMEAAVTAALDQGFRTGDLMSTGMKQVSCSAMGKILLDSLRQPAMAH